jgi:hypothetical protein
MSMRDEVAATLSVTPRTAHNMANPADLSQPDIEAPLRPATTPARGKPEAAN